MKISRIRQFTVFVLICALGTCSIYANNKTSFRYEGRPMPDWVLGQVPISNSPTTYYYRVFESVQKDRDVARIQTINQAFQQAITYLGSEAKAADVFKAIEDGMSVEVASERFKIPINITREFAKQSPDGKEWHYWILCQIAVQGNIRPAFDNQFIETYTLWEEGKKKQEEEIARQRKNVNATALAASFFIPGAGQMYKGEGGKGAGILIGELALVGGGVGTYFLGKQQLNIMQDKSILYSDFVAAKNKYNTMRVISYSCYGAAAALYVFNLCHAYMMEPNKKKFPQFSYNPTIIPLNEYSTPNYALGMGVTIKF